VGGFDNETTDEDSLKYVATAAVWKDEEFFENETELRPADSRRFTSILKRL
jgi:hypothetical protein